MSLLESRVGYKPFHYPWAYDAWLKQQQMHWLPDEVPMADDIKDWKYNLTTAEINLCTQIFKFFTQSDIDVNDCYMTKYSNIFKPVEVKMMLSAFSNMETIHIAAYSHLIEVLGMKDEIYEEFMNYKEMVDKHNFIEKFDADSKEGIALIMAIFGAFMEGMQLFASFAILLNFQRFGKMKGMGQIITWSVRDETLHTNSIIKLFRTFIAENPFIWTEKFRAQIYEGCSTMVYFEDAFIDLAFEFNEGGVQGLAAEDVKRYIRYIADRRLLQLGLKPRYLIESNPLPWLDSILNAVEHANFFENRATEYSKSATTGTWDEAFSMHDGLI